jgi:hypothetical protein
LEEKALPFKFGSSMMPFIGRKTISGGSRLYNFNRQCFSLGEINSSLFIFKF